MFAIRKNNSMIKYSIVPKNIPYFSLKNKNDGKTMIQKIYCDPTSLVNAKSIPLYYFYTTILFGLGILFIYNKHGK